MIKSELLAYSIKNLVKAKKRTWLTIISVLIGIAAITTLISFGQGVSFYVSDFAQKMGDDKLVIQPGSGALLTDILDTNIKFDDSDVEAVRKTVGVAEATGLYAKTGEVEFNDEKKYVFIIGSDFKDHRELIDEVYTVKIIHGKGLRGDEKRKAVLGYNYLLDDKIFEKPIKLGDRIVVNDEDIKIVGFYEEVGNPQDDSNIYFTNDAMKTLFGSESYQYVMARSSIARNPSEVADAVKENLRKHRGLKKGDEDFFVQTFEQIIETFNSILGIITTVIILIAFISLIVAGVNIMNTSYASILDRTKEVGVFKAVGSKNSDILAMFVLEASILSLVGGLLGVALGFSVSTIAGYFISAAGYSVFTPVFTWELVVSSLVFALIIGSLSGLVPAYKASKLRPVDALRYE